MSFFSDPISLHLSLSRHPHPRIRANYPAANDNKQLYGRMGYNSALQILSTDTFGKLHRSVRAEGDDKMKNCSGCGREGNEFREAEDEDERSEMSE